MKRLRRLPLSTLDVKGVKFEPVGIFTLSERGIEECGNKDPSLD